MKPHHPPSPHRHAVFLRRLVRKRGYLSVLGLAVAAMLALVIMQSLLLPWCIFGNDNPSVSPNGLRRQMSIVPSTTSSSFAGRTPDGYFNSHPLYLETERSFHSTVHCVGETHSESTAWMHRSCDYTYLCFDPSSSSSSPSTLSTTHDAFFVVASSLEAEMQRERLTADATPSYVSTELTTTTTTTTTTSATQNSTTIMTPPIALGGINPRWVGTKFNQGIEKVKWSPRVVDKPPSQFYLLDNNVVLLPFHSFAGHNVGHLLWDDFWPLYTLLQMFGYMQDNEKGLADSVDLQPLLLRVDTLPTLFASCEIQSKKRLACENNFDKFLPLLGIDPKTFSTLKTIRLTKTLHGDGGRDGGSRELPLHPICAKHAVAGMGMLTDHGLTDHGWEPKPQDAVHNVGRGPLYYQFRNFMLRNMNLPVKPPQWGSSSPLSSSSSRQPEFRILLNANSSRDMERRVDFQQQLHALQQAFPTTEVVSVTMKDMELKEQVQLVSQSPKHTIFVSTCGGGSMTSFFLPRGSSVIFYYNEHSGFNYQDFKLTGGPAMLDWDLFNNLSYLRVHWLPIGTPPMGLRSNGAMNSDEAMDALTYLIRHEMDGVINSIL